MGEKKLHPRVHYAGIGQASLELISAAETSYAEKGVGCFLNTPREGNVNDDQIELFKLVGGLDESSAGTTW